MRKMDGGERNMENRERMAEDKGEGIDKLRIVKSAPQFIALVIG